jgi:hypothetical protein
MLETYHRAVEMIEKRFKSEYDNSYKQIRKVIANYITLIINSPENFEIDLSRKDIMIHLTKYLTETDDEEIGFFLMDVYNSTNGDISFLASIFGYIFNIIHTLNIENKPHFFNLEKIRRNLNLLTLLFNNCPLSAQVYVQEGQFNPNVLNGKIFQTSSYLSIYLNMSVFEADINSLRNNLPMNKSMNDLEAITKSYSNKLIEYLNELVNFIYSIFNVNEITRKAVFDWIYRLIELNFEKTKMYQNHSTSSSLGFLLNTLIVLLKIFFDQSTYLKLQYPEFIFKIISDVDPLFTISNNRINFKKFERVNSDMVKAILENEDDDHNNKEYNLNTQMFFIIHTLLSYTLKTFDDEISFISNKLEELQKENKVNDPQFKDFFSIIKGAQTYLKNNELNKHILKFSEIASVFLFSLNNKKYPQIRLFKDKVDYSEFLSDFYDYIDLNDNFALSLLPVYVIKNLSINCIYIRKYSSDTFINELNSTKTLIYFSIIYSSYLELIKNPHLRSEIFDILIYLFVIHSNEKNMKSNNIILIYSC